MPPPAAAAAVAASYGTAQPPPAAAFDQLSAGFDQDRAPGFELPDWDWQQPAAGAAAGRRAAPPTQQQPWEQEQQQQYGDWGADAYWPDEAAQLQAGDEWRAVEQKPRGGQRGGGAGGGTQPFEPAVQLSRTRIMVRNLQPDTTQYAVENAFKR